MGSRVVRAAVLAVAILIALGGASYVAQMLAPRLHVTFVVPDGYAGYLITRWQCPGGRKFPRNLFGAAQDLTLPFDASGAACIADSIPSAGFGITGFRFASGAAAPVIVGGTRGLQGNRPPGELQFVMSPVASIGIGNGQILGDECSFRAFVEERFDVELNSPIRCDPIFVMPNPAISLTPGQPSTP